MRPVQIALIVGALLGYAIGYSMAKIREEFGKSLVSYLLRK